MLLFIVVHDAAWYAVALSAKCPGKVIFNGIDAVLPYGIQAGAHGGIGTTYSILPELYLEIDRLTRADECAAAMQLTRRANAANSNYKVVPSPWREESPASRCF